MDSEGTELPGVLLDDMAMLGQPHARDRRVPGVGGRVQSGEFGAQADPPKLASRCFGAFADDPRDANLRLLRRSSAAAPSASKQHGCRDNNDEGRPDPAHCAWEHRRALTGIDAPVARWVRSPRAQTTRDPRGGDCCGRRLACGGRVWLSEPGLHRARPDHPSAPLASTSGRGAWALREGGRAARRLMHPATRPAPESHLCRCWRRAVTSSAAAPARWSAHASLNPVQPHPAPWRSAPQGVRFPQSSS